MAAMILLLIAAVLASSPASAQDAKPAPKYCYTVHARYAIYVERDSLWIPGSKHYINVPIDELDKKLQAKGWEDWVAFGDFDLCTDSDFKPLSLWRANDVTVKGYKNIVFRKRP